MSCESLFMVPTILSGQRIMRRICLATGISCNKNNCPKEQNEFSPEQKNMADRMKELKANTGGA